MIRKYIMEDIPFIVELENKTLNTSLGSQMFVDNINNEMATSYVYLGDNNKIIGYISTVFDGQIVEILNYCVDPSYQNKGIGKKLLNYVLDVFYAKGASSAILEVRESNIRAIHVYESFGFKKISVRKNYYSNGENALVLQKLFINAIEVENAYYDNFVKRENGIDYIKVYDDIQTDKYYHNYYVVNNNTNIEALLDKPFKGFNHFLAYENLSDRFKDFEVEHNLIMHSNINTIEILSKVDKKVSRLNEKNISLVKEFIYKDSLAYGEEYAKGNLRCLVDADFIEHKLKAYVAFADDKIVGYLHTFLYKGYAKIEDFFVLDEYQKKGYGSSLYSYAIEELKKEGCTDVIMDADAYDTAKDMYQRMGFNIVSEYYMYLRKC